jgi:hypothetical protein
MIPLVDCGLFFRVLIKMMKLFLTKKMQERLVACSQDDLYVQYGFDRATMPSFLGGDVNPQSLEDEHAAYASFIRACLARRDESIEKVHI